MPFFSPGFPGVLNIIYTIFCYLQSKLTFLKSTQHDFIGVYWRRTKPKLKDLTMALEKILLSQSDAATYLGTTVGTLNTWRHHGKIRLPEIRWGNRIKYRKTDIDAWIEQNTTIPDCNDCNSL